MGQQRSHPTEADVALWTELANQGLTAAEIGRRTGAVAQTVRNALFRSGVTTHRGRAVRQGRALAREHVAAWVDRYLAGDGTQRIADDYGVGRPAVSAALERAGVKLRGPGPVAGVEIGERAHTWKGGELCNSDGYRLVWVHPNDPMACMRQSRGYVLEHRLVMARMIHRPLDPSETVHHINGERSDNRPENLQLRQGKHGTGAHLRCGDCGSGNVVARPI